MLCFRSDSYHSINIQNDVPVEKGERETKKKEEITFKKFQLACFID